jgi:hypothetical protein
MSVASVVEALPFLALDAMALGLVIIVPYRLSFVIRLHFLAMLALMNVWSGLLLLGPLIVAALMLAHHIFWPTVLRPLYLAQRVRVIQNKLVLAAVGLILLAGACSPNIADAGRILQAVLKRIVG